MIPKTLSLLAALLVSACATQAVPPSQARAVPQSQITSAKYAKLQEGASTLTFVRDSGMYGSAATIYIFIDGEEIAGFSTSETMKMYLQPGEYLLGVQSKPNFGLEPFIEAPTRIEVGKNYGFRIGVDYGKAIVQRTSAF